MKWIKELSNHFTLEDIHMVNYHVQYSQHHYMQYLIGNIHIKTTPR
jgi:hypothetical protein